MNTKRPLTLQRYNVVTVVKCVVIVKHSDISEVDHFNLSLYSLAS